jgi:hypothetical protein
MGMTDPVVITKEMGITYSDFFRTIPRAIGSEDYTQSANGIDLEGEGKRLTITLGPQGERKIALMVIPRTPVTLSFTGYTEAEIKAAVKRFDMMFKKGGG